MKDRNRTLLRYILPSAGGLCVTYLYNIVDGIFVGQGVGHPALAAVNITVPFITTLVALSSLFAMGGSTVIAIRLGRGDQKGANDAFLTAFCMTLVLSAVLLAVGTLLPEQIALLCGSSPEILPLARDYLFYYTLFSIPFLMSNCLSVFVRNDGAPGLAFFGMCAGAVANISWTGSSSFRCRWESSSRCCFRTRADSVLPHSDQPLSEKKRTAPDPPVPPVSRPGRKDLQTRCAGMYFPAEHTCHSLLL